MKSEKKFSAKRLDTIKFVLICLLFGAVLLGIAVFSITWDYAGYGFMGSLAVGAAIIIRLATGNDSYVNCETQLPHQNAEAAVIFMGLEGTHLDGVCGLGDVAGDAGDGGGDCGGGDAACCM